MCATEFIYFWKCLFDRWSLLRYSSLAGWCRFFGTLLRLTSSTYYDCSLEIMNAWLIVVYRSAKPRWDKRMSYAGILLERLVTAVLLLLLRRRWWEYWLMLWPSYLPIIFLSCDIEFLTWYTRSIIDNSSAVNTSPCFVECFRHTQCCHALIDKKR